MAAQLPGLSRGPSPLVLVTLKLHLLRGGLRRSAWQVVGLVLAVLYAAGLVLAAGAGLVALRGADAAVAAAVVALGGAVLTAGWALVPLVAFGADATLDPARLAPFGVPPRRLVLGLLGAALVGVPGAATAVLALATVVTWSRGPLVVAVAAAGAVLGLLTCVAASRAVTTAAAGALSGRRAREVAAALVVLLAVSVGPSLSLLSGSAVSLGPAGLQRAATAAGWTPLGWAWSAPGEVALGRPGAGLAKLALAAALLLALLAVWSLALRRALEGGGARRRRRAGRARPVRDAAAAERPGSALLARLEARGPAGAVAARCLRYWRRDTRYVVALVGVLAFPVAAAVLGAGALPRQATALVVPLVLAAALGWAVHDDTAYDGSAFWLHLATGLTGRADRAGRALGLLLWAVPLVVAVAVAGAAAGGRWVLLPALLGAALALLGGGTGVSCVASALVAYPVPEAGANPFGSRPGATATGLLVQAVTSAATGLVALPALVLLVLAAVLDGPVAVPVLSATCLVVGAATGAGAVTLGVVQGGRVLDRRGPALLAALSR